MTVLTQTNNNAGNVINNVKWTRTDGEKMRPKIYIAGPMSQGDKVDNLAQAMKAFVKLAKIGYAPLCPQFTFFIEPFCQLLHNSWLEIDLPWVKEANAVLRLPGPSAGADREVELALKYRIPVFKTINELIEAIPAGATNV